MAIAFGAAGTLGGAASGTSIVPALPAGVVAGQLLIGVVASKNNGTHTWPAGWTKQDQVNSGASWTVSFATKIAGPSESAPTVSWTGSVANTGQIWSYTGTDLFLAIGAKSAGSTGTTSPHSSASITTTRANSFGIYIDACSANTALTLPGGYTSDVNNGNATAVVHVDSGHKLVTTSGSATGAISTAGGVAAWVEWQVEVLVANPVPWADITNSLSPAFVAPIEGTFALRTWVFGTANVLKIPVPGPLPAYDWQAAPPPQPIEQTWARNQTLIITPRPAGPLPAYEWATAPPLEQPIRFWTSNALQLRAVLAPAGEQVFELAPRPPPPPVQTWTWSYNLNLRGKDFFPPGGIIDELAPRPYARLPDYTWTEFYNLTLIGRDRFPPGDQFFELTPRNPVDPNSFRSWFWQLTLRIAPNFTALPSNDWTPPLPLPAQAQTWTANPTPLRVAVGLPPGESIYDLAPRPYLRLADYTWTEFYNLTLIGQDKLPSGEQVTDRPAVPPFLRDWAQSLTTSTLFAVALPPGTQVDERPPVSPFYRDWAVNFALTGPTPFTTYNFDWPLPGRAPLPVPSWAWSYNLNLIGQDFLPVGDRLYDRPVLLPVEPATRTWTLWLNLTTLNEPVGVQRYDLPSPVSWLRSWSLNLLQTTLAPVTAPFLTFDWTPPRPQPPAAVGQATAFPLTLIGQDQLPKGEQVTDLPPPQPLRAENLKSWIENTNLALLTQPALPPIRQYDWPVPLAFRQGALGQTSSYLATLVGQDQLPTGVQRYDLAPLGIKPTDLRSWIWYLSQALTALNFPNGIQVDDLPPRAPQPVAPSQASSFPLTLVGQDQLPTGQQRYELAPRGTLPTDYRSWVYFTSLALNGSLGIPVGAQLYELAPRAALPTGDLRTWLERTKLALLPVPFNQYDWPLPGTPQLPQRSWAGALNLDLITSVAPFSQTYWPLPIAPQVPQRSWVNSFNLNLIGQDQFPPGRQVSELSPFGYPYPFSLRTGTASPAVPPIVVVTAGGETLLMMGMG